MDARAKAATRWFDYVAFPLEWTANELFFLLPALGLLLVLYWRQRPVVWPTPTPQAAFDRRCITALAFGPFLVTTAVALGLGRLPVAMWGYPLWSFAPLAVIAWLGPFTAPQRLNAFALAFAAIFVAWPLAYAGTELFEPMLRDREKATQFPGEDMALRITREWREAFGEPLAYVCGSEFVANTVAVYSPDRPRVIVHCDPSLSPWIDIADVHRRGAVLAWDQRLIAPTDVERWRAALGEFQTRPVLSLPRRTLLANPRSLQPVRVFNAFLPPKPVTDR